MLVNQFSVVSGLDEIPAGMGAVRIPSIGFETLSVDGVHVGQWIDLSAGFLLLDPGEHELEFRSDMDPKCTPRGISVFVVAEEATWVGVASGKVIELETVRLRGCETYLRFDSDVSGEVFIDGQRVGAIGEIVPTISGPHCLEVRLSGEPLRSIQVDLAGSPRAFTLQIDVRTYIRLGRHCVPNGRDE